MRILFVCLGNICRSPTAEGVMRGLVAERGLDGEIEVDSAGTAGWHAGDPPDSRSIAAAASRGVTLTGASRQVTPADFFEFDLLVAMDGANERDLLAIAPGADAAARVRLLRSFSNDDELDVPDPYYGGHDGFDEVVRIVDRSCRALLDEIESARAGAES